jgi:hypothetical protein
MKPPTKLACLLAALSCLCAAVVATSEDAPVLKITKIDTNVFEIGVTNGTNTGFYELYHAPVLADPAYPFTLLQVGSQGQTNFQVTNVVNVAGFYWIGVGNDFDGDGVTNAADANPHSTNFGSLTILIDSPTNGGVFQ